MSDDLKLTPEQRAAYIRGMFESSELDPVSTQLTLNHAYERATPEALLAASQKIIKLSRGEAQADNRDSLAFQTVHGTEDFLADKIRNDQNRILQNNLWKATNRGSLDRIPSGVLDAHTNHMLTDSGLGFVLEEINPLEILDQSHKVTRMGEGALPSLDSVPDSARNVQPSYAGFVDLVRSPESLKVGVDLNLARNVRKGPDNLLYTQFLDITTGKPKWVSHQEAATSIIGSSDDYDPTAAYVPAIAGMDGIQYVPRESVKYLIRSGDDLFSELAGTVPMKSGVKGMRLLMGCLAGDTLIHVCQRGGPLKSMAIEKYYRRRRRSGDLVLSIDELTGELIWVEVQGVKRNTEEHLMLRVTLQSGRTATTTDNHKWVIRGNAKLQETYAADLKVGDLVPCSDPTRTPFQEPGELCWESITSIEPAGTSAMTYDLDVNDRVFMVNEGIFVHNSKFIKSAVPLVNREASLVQSTDAEGNNLFKALASRVGAQFADQDGIVEAVTANSIKVRYADGTLEDKELYINHPYSRKTYLHNTPQVTPGQAVKKGDILASSNFTDDKGTLALGVNLRTGYSSAHGKVFEDSIVISESAAKKLASQHMYHEDVEEDAEVKYDKRRFMMSFPGKFTKEQLAKLDDNGVVRPGQVLETGDPVYVGVRQLQPGPGRLIKNRLAPEIIRWEHKHPGTVTDIGKTKKGYSAYIQSISPMEPGDKLMLPYGGKGVVSEIIPDEQMFKDAEGNTLDMLMSPLGVISRTNSAQLAAASLAKIATKTGKPYVVSGFMDENMTQFALNELEKHGLTDREDLTDPTNGRTIPQVFVGVHHVYKGSQMAESKGKSRGIAGYTMDDQPSKGGADGAKHMGSMELRGLLSHGAFDVLKDMKMIKGQANHDFWRKLKLGQTPVMPGTPTTYTKFKEMIKAAGVNLVEENDAVRIFGMTDSQAEKLTGNRKLESAGTFNQQNFKPIASGLFDPEATDSMGAGNRWAYYALPEPVLNPIMAEPVRRILGLTNAQLDAVMNGEQKIGNGYGGKALKEHLDSLDLSKIIDNARQTLRTGSKSVRDDAIKTLAYAVAMQREGVKPSEFMMTRVPVLPPAFRPITQMSGRTMVADPNYMYLNLKNAIDDFEDAKILPPELQTEARKTMVQSYKALIGLVDPEQEKLQSKNVGGILQSILGKGSPKLCYDDATDVLTEDGWVPFKDYHGQCKIATVHPFTHKVHYHRPYDIIHSDYEGDMIQINFRKKADLLVTPNHRNWVRLKNHIDNSDMSARWNFMYAEDMVTCGTRMQMLRTAEGCYGHRNIPEWVNCTPEEFAEFAGLWLAEGWIHSDRHAAEICQTPTIGNTPYCVRIHELIERIGLPFSYAEYAHSDRKDGYIPNSDHRKHWGIRDKRMVQWLSENLGEGSGNKRLSKLVRTWDESLLKALFKGYLMGDGEKIQRKKGKAAGKVARHRYTHDFTEWASFITVSPQLAQDLQELGCKIGVPVRIIELDPPTATQQRQYFGSLPTCHYATAEGKGSAAKRVPYSGGIHCVSVPNGLLIVRRNGLTCVSGNSYTQRRVIGTNIDMAGLGVATLNPNLKLNEVGLPMEEAWKLYEPFVVRGLVQQGLPAMQAAEAVASRSPKAFTVLKSVVEERPVIVNRAPTLHRYGMMALWPKLVKGHAIQMAPGIHSPYGLDHDGDQQLSSVIILLDTLTCESILSSERLSLQHKEINMAYLKQFVPIDNGVRGFVVDLADFPHRALNSVKDRSAQGKGNIEFYHVAEGVNVIAYDEAQGKPVLAPVACWSKHYDNPVELVNLKSGRQIFTDDDPRAVYGIDPDTYEFCRKRPSESIGMLVPRVDRLHDLYTNSLTEIDTGATGDKALKATIPLDRDTGYVFGCLIGDGWVVHSEGELKGQVCIAGEEEPVFDRYSKGLFKLFRQFPTVTRHPFTKETAPDRYGDSERLTISCMEFARFLKPFIGCGSNGKHLPDFSWRAPKEFRQGLLEGLMDTDGTVSVVNAKNKKPQLKTHYYTNSTRLAYELQQLLRTLDVRSRIAPSTTPAGKPCWIMNIYTADALRLEMQLQCPRKHTAYTSGVTVNEEAPAALRNDLVPVSRELAEALAKREYATNGNTSAYATYQYAKKNRYMSRLQAKKAIAAGALDNPHWSRFVQFVEDTQTTWEQVVSFEKTDIVETGYDLTVPGYETFMNAEGVILSNTLSYSVPVSKSAVDQAKNTMMPQHHLLSTQDDSPHYAPGQDYLMGMYLASKEPANVPAKRFATWQDAERAYRKGEIDIDTPVVVQ
jgi:glutaredoxin